MPPLSREYLLSRGFCCGFGCQNCPYDKDKEMPSPKTCLGCKYAEWQLTPSGKVIESEAGECKFPLEKIRPPAAALNECEYTLGPIFVDLDGCPQRECGDCGERGDCGEGKCDG